MESYGKSSEELSHEAPSTITKTVTKLLDEFNYMKFAQKEDLPDPIEDC